MIVQYRGTENHWVSSEVRMNSATSLGIGTQVRRHQVKLRSDGESAKHVEGRQIEMQRRMTGNAIRRVHAEVARCPFHKMNYVGMGDDHALGVASRT